MFLKYGNQSLDLEGKRAAIFDMDGTLVHSEPIWEYAKSAVAAELDVVASPQILTRYEGRSVEDFVREILKADDIAKTTERISALALSRYDTGLQKISGAAELLAALADAGLRIAICSSASELAIQKSLDFVNVTHKIDVIVSATNLARGKPDKLPYVTTLEKLALKPAEAIVFEDAQAGVTSAISAGIQTVFVGNAANVDCSACVMRAAEIGQISLFH